MPTARQYGDAAKDIVSRDKNSSAHAGSVRQIRKMSAEQAKNYGRGLVKRHGRNHVVPEDVWYALKAAGGSPGSLGLQHKGPMGGRGEGNYTRKKKGSAGKAAAKGAAKGGAY